MEAGIAVVSYQDLQAPLANAFAGGTFGSGYETRTAIDIHTVAHTTFVRISIS